MQHRPILFFLAALEIYVLALLVLRRVWMALLISLLMGTNLVLLAYVKPVMSDENRGHDTGPSTTTIVYNTNSPKTPQVQLMVATPGIPAATPIWLAVDLPSVPGTGNFLLPVGKIMITVDARPVLPETDRASDVLITSCDDRT